MNGEDWARYQLIAKATYLADSVALTRNAGSRKHSEATSGQAAALGRSGESAGPA
jgi:hypothetical protein